MPKTQQGISQRQYARRAGCSAAYVQKLIAKGKLPVLPDGSLDPEACDSARQHSTRVGRGKRRWERRHPEPKPVVVGPWEGSFQQCPVCDQVHWIVPMKACQKCGNQYSPYGAAKYNYSNNPDPMTYCSAECAGIQKPKPVTRICEQCGDPAGYIVAEAREYGEGNADPSRYCDRDCSYDAKVGKTRAQTRQRLLAHWRADGYNDKGLRADGYDWLLEKPAK